MRLQIGLECFFYVRLSYLCPFRTYYISMKITYKLLNLGVLKLKIKIFGERAYNEKICINKQIQFLFDFCRQKV